jgi:hypothetical protein
VVATKLLVDPTGKKMVKIAEKMGVKKVLKKIFKVI